MMYDYRWTYSSFTSVKSRCSEGQSSIPSFSSHPLPGSPLPKQYVKKPRAAARVYRRRYGCVDTHPYRDRCPDVDRDIEVFGVRVFV